MREIAGAIVILAGAVLIAAGMIVDGINHSRGGYGVPGYFLGGIVGFVGVLVCASGSIKRGRDETPTEDELREQAATHFS